MYTGDRSTSLYKDVISSDCGILNRVDFPCMVQQMSDYWDLTI